MKKIVPPLVLVFALAGCGATPPTTPWSDNLDPAPRLTSEAADSIPQDERGGHYMGSGN